jgi:RNA-directed DNA polymerase
MVMRTTTTRITQLCSCLQEWKVVNDITFEEVISAYYDCRRNKRNTSQQLNFEFHLENNLWNLYEELKNETFTPSSHLFFIITKPKPREVWAAEFKDRIVHHIIYNQNKLY